MIARVVDLEPGKRVVASAQVLTTRFRKFDHVAVCRLLVLLESQGLATRKMDYSGRRGRPATKWDIPASIAIMFDEEVSSGQESA